MQLRKNTKPLYELSNERLAEVLEKLPWEEPYELFGLPTQRAPLTSLPMPWIMILENHNVQIGDMWYEIGRGIATRKGASIKLPEKKKSLFESIIKIGSN